MKRACFKIILLVGLCSLFTQSLNAQQWNAMGQGINSGGNIGWSVNTLIEDSGYLFVGGDYETAGALSIIGCARWDGMAWSHADSGNIGYSAFNTFAFYKGTLYAGGSFGTASWNGATWQDIGRVWSAGAGDNITPPVYQLVVYDSLLFLGGRFDTVNGISAQNIAIWNGSVWSMVGDGKMNNSDYEINTMTIYEGKLIVGGNFDSIGGIAANNVAQWDGNSWSALDTGVRDWVNSLVAVDGNLYAGGYSLHKWDGASWTDFAKTNGEIYALANDGDNLIIGGAFDTIGNNASNGIAEWNGISWFSFGSGIKNEVNCLLIDNGNLYAGGIFDSAGGNPANDIAVWNLRTGINPIPSTTKTIIYPNPGNGSLNIALGTTIEHCQIDFYNLLGEKVYHSYINTGNTMLNIGRQASGVYLYRVYKEDGTLVEDGKYVLE